MQRNPVHIEPVQARLDQRHLAPRRICTVSLSMGFFTLGFAIVVLAASSLLAGAAGALNVSDAALAPTPSTAVVQSTQPVDQVKAEGARTVVIGEARVRSPDDARGGTMSQQ